MSRTPRAFAAAFAAACCIASTMAWAQVPPVTPTQTDPAKLEQAKKHMEAGAAFYNDPSGHKCEEALTEFGKAYEYSGSLNALRGMGICALELERDGEAVELLERYIKGKGDTIEPADKKQLDADLAALKAAMATITFETDRPKVRITTVRTPSRGYPITNRYEVGQGKTPLGIHPGSYVITASAPGEKDLTWKVEIGNGDSSEHPFLFSAGGSAPAAPPAAGGTVGGDETTPPEDEGGERPIPTTVWIFGGLTVALAVPTVIFMVSASGARSDFDEANGTAPAAELEDLRSDVTTMNLLSDIFLVGTVASAAATTIFFVTRPTESTAAAATPARRLVPVVTSVAPVVGARGGGAFVTGTF